MPGSEPHGARQRCHRLHGWPVAPRLLRSFLPSNEH
ncbi:MAG: hypothetical protein EBW19_10555 [Betaproteobacteria bacterium]|nr:hypothetical protein [Betaproteobacteria bacterium]